MLELSPEISTGLKDLDRLLCGLIPGDNVVWQVQDIEDYRAFVLPYCREAISCGKHVIYFRFARHDPVVPDPQLAEVHPLRPEMGFEAFLTQIHGVIEQSGRGAFYVFDCLSDLAVDWFSDQMLGNFFLLTCPRLFDLQTVAYFALLRNHHSLHATNPIRKTTQLFLDIYRHKGHLYLRPLKVQGRYSASLHALHVWDETGFNLVPDSNTTANVLTSTPRSALELTLSQLDAWNRDFLVAEEMFNGQSSCLLDTQRATDTFNHLLRMSFSRDERILNLARQYLGLRDIIEIGKRTIGTGLIGGKASGMLLARAILKQASPRWEDSLEIHDSFYVGSDVYYTFLVQNGCWWPRQNLNDMTQVLKEADQTRHRILTGTFPDHLMKQFHDMLEYFGQSPIIVRSSSLLEDNFGNSFAGKYESVFCGNQGSFEHRLDDFLAAVKIVYASTFGHEALTYRARHNVLHHDEQMALLVQRVSGSTHGQLYYPEIGGVGFSFNPYVWSPEIEPEAGMVRLAFGLGTRAVDRMDDDHTRVVALSAPSRRPESNLDELREYSQRKVDVLDLNGNRLVSLDIHDVMKGEHKEAIDLFWSRDTTLDSGFHGVEPPSVPYGLLTFDRFLSKSLFVPNTLEVFRILQEAYACPVDIEFTVNLLGGGMDYRMNLVQCRPLQVRGQFGKDDLPQLQQRMPQEDIVLESRGPIIGHSRHETVDLVVYVVPWVYAHITLSDKYSVARWIGRLFKTFPKGRTILLAGPGRWGTRSPHLGVPVSFVEINSVSVLCEMVTMHDGLVPDVSLGTHFFSELVEAEILYMAVFPGRQDHWINRPFFEESQNMLSKFLPEAECFENAIRVIDLSETSGQRPLWLYADNFRQRAVCYLAPPKSPD